MCGGAAFLALVAAAVLPASALAETFCVNDPGCSGTSKATITEAFTAAQANGAGKDRVQVGPGVYHSSFGISRG